MVESTNYSMMSHSDDLRVIATQQSEDEEDDEDFNQVQHNVFYGDSASRNVDNHKRVIVHIDIDCFYAQVETLHNPDLINKPLGIQQKNIIVTCNYVAREKGVTKLSYLKDALKKCPEIVIVNGEDLTKYRDMSYKITDFLLKYSLKVERLGFDENFIDVTGLVNERMNSDVIKLCLPKTENHNTIAGHVYAVENSNLKNVSQCYCGCHKRLLIGSQIAAEIRKSLHQELGITCCAGIAHNKLLAKLVGATHKPNQQTVLLPEFITELMVSLKDVRKIPGIGSSTSKRLQSIGLTSVTDLQTCSRDTLSEQFGPLMAQNMADWSLGIDHSEVVKTGPPQSISDEDSFRKCCNITDVKVRLKGILKTLMTRLLQDGRHPQTLRLTLRRVIGENKWSSRESRQCPIPTYILKNLSTSDTDQADDAILNLLTSLFNKMVDISKPFHITLLNICFTKFENQEKVGTISAFFKRQTEADSNNGNDITSNEDPQNKSTRLNTINNKSSHGSSRKRSFDMVSWLKSPPKSVTKTKYAKSSPDMTQPNMTPFYDSQGSKSETCHTKTINVSPEVLSKNNEKTGEGISNISPYMGIDETVLKELPEDIQNEILSDIQSVTCKNYSKMSNPVCTISDDTLSHTYVTPGYASVTSDSTHVLSSCYTGVTPITASSVSETSTLDHTSVVSANSHVTPNMVQVVTSSYTCVTQGNTSETLGSTSVTSDYESMTSTYSCREPFHMRMIPENTTVTHTNDTSVIDCNTSVTDCYTSVTLCNTSVTPGSSKLATVNSSVTNDLSTSTFPAISTSSCTSPSAIISPSPVRGPLHKDVPPGFDETVFSQLPSDIQVELVNEWKQRKKVTQKKKTGIMQYFQKLK
ncbi:unnamed protein product [Owenia fusiformis]|uniref:Uncharacterized protein n=1 Tax=Owenia fusiformis TaxID=6347 RepID=A0A8J1XTV6_OWEFU|nr:unnamed protein product [Owenia fusiformis]